MLNFPILLWNIGFYFVCEKLIEMEQNYIVSIWAWKSHLWVVGTNRLEDYNKLPFVCRFCSLHWKTQFKKQHNSKKPKRDQKPTILLLSNYVSTANRLEIVLFKRVIRSLAARSLWISVWKIDLWKQRSAELHTETK